MLAERDPVEHRQRILSNAVPPVMSYFDPTKLTTSGRTFLEAQRARWGGLAGNAAVIAIVGVQVRPHDSHIWAPLRDTSAQLVYCSGQAAAERFKEWAAVERQGKRDRVLPDYFRRHFGEICQHLGL